jgi:hypothetical protein
MEYGLFKLLFTLKEIQASTLAKKEVSLPHLYIYLYWLKILNSLPVGVILQLSERCNEDKAVSCFLNP